MLSEQELELKRATGRAYASTLLLKTMLQLIPKRPEYKHGMTPKEIQEGFEFLVDHHLIQKIPIETFENRVRDCYHLHKTAGKHKVPTLVLIKGKWKKKLRIHYFPLALDDQGLIDHSKCNCERRQTS